MVEENVPSKSGKPKCWVVQRDPPRRQVERCRQSTDIGWKNLPVSKRPESNERWKMDNPVLCQRITRGKPFARFCLPVAPALTANKLKKVDSYGDSSFCSEEEYSWNGCYLSYYDAEKEETVKLSNFAVSIVEVRTIVKETGDERWLKLQIVTRRGSFLMELPYVKYINLKEILGEQHPECAVYQTAHAFRQYLHWVADNELEAAKEAIVYQKHGWTDVAGKQVYLHGNMPNVISAVTLEPDSQKAAQFLQLYGGLIRDDESRDVLLLYCLNSYIAGLFEQLGGIGCRSVLCITAPTGSYKTAVATVLASALNPNPVLRFDDTEASIEENLLAAKDLLILQDDFYPHGDKTTVAAFKRKAMKVARIIGDGRAPGKMGQDRKPLSNRNYHGGVLLTGEILDLTSHSSYLRSLCIRWNKGFINTGTLTVLQGDKMLAKAFFSSWIKYVQENVNILRRLIEDPLCSYGGAARMESSFKALGIIAELFSDFANSIGHHVDYAVMISHVLTSIRKTENLAKDFSPAEVAIRALMEAIENGPLVIVADKETFMKVAADGYYEGDSTICLISNRAEDIVSRYAASHGCVASFDANVKAELAERGFLKKTGSAFTVKFTKNRKVSPMRPQMLEINIKE